MKHPPKFSRRTLLQTMGRGFGSLALAAVSQLSAAAQPRQPRLGFTHHAARARRVIFLYMEGGPSQLDMLEHKPSLSRLAGKTVQFQEDAFQFNGRLMPALWPFDPCPTTDLYFSSLLPHLSAVSHELCLLHGMHTDSSSHDQATIMVHTGATSEVRPSMGSWVAYGMGSENEKLPSFVTINPLDHLGGAQNYSSAFLPAKYQGTRISVSGDLIPNIANPFTDDAHQRRFLDLVQGSNANYLARLGDAAEVEGIIQAYDLAYHMQHALPQVMRLNQETTATKQLYGITDENPQRLSVQCLMARRLAEAGVRFIQLTARGWDNHTELPANLPHRCREIDQPIAGLITDLRQRGLLDDTLVVWGGEFGRSAAEQNDGDGRRHQNMGYTMFLAGAGVRGGMAYGSTDETGSRAVEGKIHTHDLHATILHLLGLNHERLTYRYAGRDFRLTDVYGRVVREIIS